MIVYHLLRTAKLVYHYNNPNQFVDVLGLAPTKELKKNMNKANRDLAKHYGYQNRAWHKVKGSAAHHIVAGTGKRAEPARKVLQKYGINIDGADNGIYLKHMCKCSNQPGAYHREIHTDVYYQNVNARIMNADRRGKQAVLKELDSIRNDLLFNRKIW